MKTNFLAYALFFSGLLGCSSLPKDVTLNGSRGVAGESPQPILRQINVGDLKSRIIELNSFEKATLNFPTGKSVVVSCDLRDENGSVSMLSNPNMPFNDLYLDSNGAVASNKVLNVFRKTVEVRCSPTADVADKQGQWRKDQQEILIANEKTKLQEGEWKNRGESFLKRVSYKCETAGCYQYISPTSFDGSPLDCSVPMNSKMPGCFASRPDYCSAPMYASEPSCFGSAPSYCSAPMNAEEKSCVGSAPDYCVAPAYGDARSCVGSAPSYCIAPMYSKVMACGGSLPPYCNAPMYANEPSCISIPKSEKQKKAFCENFPDLCH